MTFKYKGYEIEMRFKDRENVEQPVFSCKELKLFSYNKLENIKNVITNKMITRTVLRRSA